MTVRRPESRNDAEFTPAQVAAITGVSVVLQRDWRRRGYLSSSSDGKHNRYGLRDVCLIYALRAFSDTGLGPRFVYEMDIPAIGNDFKHVVSRIGDYINGDRSPESRFAVFDRGSLTMFSNLADYGSFREIPGNSLPVSIIFDCKHAADVIVRALDPDRDHSGKVIPDGIKE